MGTQRRNMTLTLSSNAVAPSALAWSAALGLSLLGCEQPLGPAGMGGSGSMVVPDPSPEAPPIVQIDLDGDQIPDAFDTNGDGVADAIDTDGDGAPDAYDTDGDGEVDDWDGDGEPDPLPPGVDNGDLAGENSDADGYCFDAEAGWRECDDGAPPGSGVPGTPELGDPGLGGPPPPPPPPPPPVEEEEEEEEEEEPPPPPPPPPPVETCSTQDFAANETIPPRILLVVDKSGSMQDGAIGYPGSKWEGAVSALSAVVTSLSGEVDFGLSLYPDGDANNNVCAEGSLDVPVGGNPSAIVNALEATFPGGGTPTAPTLERARGILQALPGSGGARVVVLATDGGPNCNVNLDPDTCRCVNPGVCNDARNCVDEDNALAAASSLQAAGFSVFVIGIPGSENFVDILNGLAEAGGTALPGATRYYSATNATALATSLENIASRVAICRFDLSTVPPAGASVGVSVGGAALSRDAGRGNGWDFIDADTIELFGPACSNLVNTPANVRIEVCVTE